jgi:hypothetical protein
VTRMTTVICVPAGLTLHSGDIIELHAVDGGMEVEMWDALHRRLLYEGPV